MNYKEFINKRAKLLMCPIFMLTLHLYISAGDAMADANLVRADYKNPLKMQDPTSPTVDCWTTITPDPPDPPDPPTNFSVDSPTSPTVECATSAVFFGGHVGKYSLPGSGYTPIVPNDGISFLVESSFGQPLARSVSYPGYVQGSIDNALAKLYYDKARDDVERDTAAFRYKWFLYSRSNDVQTGEEYIQAQFNNISDYWGDDERERALEAAAELKESLKFAPWDRSLRWTLLDIYYDIAVADLALANDKMVKAAQSSLGIVGSGPGEFLISEEIDLLEKTLPLYNFAIVGYFGLLVDPMGVDINDPMSMGEDLEFNNSDVPFGYYIFEQEVPQRSLYSPLLKDTNGWVLPADTTGAVTETEYQLLSGYKDLVLLFNIQRNYVRAASELVRRYIMRGMPGDIDEAKNLIGTVVQTSVHKGQTILGICPDYADYVDDADDADDEDDEDAVSHSGLQESINGWKHEISELSYLESYTGIGSNLLGFSDDFLVFAQSVIPGNEETDYFDTFDFLKDYLNDPTYRGPLYVAIEDLETAKDDYDNYQDRHDQLAEQFQNKTETYDARLFEIVGAYPGEDAYDTPYENDGSEISLRYSSYEQAQKRIEINKQKMDNLEEQVKIEVARRGEEAGINDAIGKIYIDYGDKQAALTEEIAAIAAWQAFADNVADAAASVEMELSPTPGVTISGGLIAYIVNAHIQKGLEEQKGQKEAAKETLAALERSEIASKEDELLDANSRALIKTWMLSMKTMAIESEEAVLAMSQEYGRLTALLHEQEDLERRKEESYKFLADRYFADPSHRLLKEASILKADLSFQEAQKWMFITIRALEYKWNKSFFITKYNHDYSSETILSLRNAQELEDMYDAMVEFDAKMSLSGFNDDWYAKFSIKNDFLSYLPGSDYVDPQTNELVSDIDAFQSHLSNPDLEKDSEYEESGLTIYVKSLRLEFDTAKSKEAMGFFSRNNWLEKIKYLRVKVIGSGEMYNNNSIVQGQLIYGGTSFIRNEYPGEVDPDYPDRVVGEMTDYSTQQWYWKDDVVGWQSKDALGASIAVQLSEDPDVPPGVQQIDIFKGRSVATTGWVLFLPLEDEYGLTVIDTSKVEDIEIHFYYYYYDRP